jgi:hypothetical protein
MTRANTATVKRNSAPGKANMAAGKAKDAGRATANQARRLPAPLRVARKLLITLVIRRLGFVVGGGVAVAIAVLGALLRRIRK